MYDTKATCLECDGEGERYITAPGLPRAPHPIDCEHCDGTGECGCSECVNTASENAFSDMCESEPPLSAQERHEAAWRQKQELRR